MPNQGNEVEKTLLVALSAAGGKVPEWVQLIPFGQSKTEKGEILLDEAAAQDVLNYYKSRKNDPVVDYEHQTLTGKEAPAAGWLTAMESRGAEGVWGKVEWCKRAAEFLAGREYRYLSPVMLLDQKTRRVKALLQAALTNFPAIDGMAPVVAKQDTQDPAAAGEAGKNEEEGITMNKIMEALGLAATATENEAMAAITTLKEAAGKMPVACKAVMEALGLKEDAKESEVTGTIVAMKTGSASAGDLAAQVKSLSDRLAARDAEELVQLAMKDGKIAPAQAEWAKKYASTDPEGFKVFAAKAPVVVPQGEHGKPPATPPESQELNASELVACKQLGITAEQYKKHNKKA